MIVEKNLEKGPEPHPVMNNFSSSDLAARIRLYLLDNYPPGAKIPMSEFQNKMPYSPPEDKQGTKAFRSSQPVTKQTVAQPQLVVEKPPLQKEKAKELPAAKEKRLELHPPAPNLHFESKDLKEKIGELFPSFSLQPFLLVIKPDEAKESETLLQAIRTKLASCDLYTLEEGASFPKGSFRAVIGTESALAIALPKGAKVNFPTISFIDWPLLGKDKEAKKELWNRLTTFCKNGHV